MSNTLLKSASSYRPAIVAGLSSAITSDNKFYLLRSLRCRSSSRARPLRAEDALRPPACGPALAGSGRRSGHIFACAEDVTSKNVKVKPTLCESPRKAVFLEISARGRDGIYRQANEDY